MGLTLILSKWYFDIQITEENKSIDFGQRRLKFKGYVLEKQHFPNDSW